MPFTCSICEEESTRICVACTKDSCENHLCEKCGRCSDCCGCEVALNEVPAHEPLYARNGTHHDAVELEPPVIPAEEALAEPAVEDPAEPAVADPEAES